MVQRFLNRINGSAKWFLGILLPVLIGGLLTWLVALTTDAASCNERVSVVCSKVDRLEAESSEVRAALKDLNDIAKRSAVILETMAKQQGVNPDHK